MRKVAMRVRGLAGLILHMTAVLATGGGGARSRQLVRVAREQALIAGGVGTAVLGLGDFIHRSLPVIRLVPVRLLAPVVRPSSSPSSPPSYHSPPSPPFCLRLHPSSHPSCPYQEPSTHPSCLYLRWWHQSFPSLSFLRRKTKKSDYHSLNIIKHRIIQLTLFMQEEYVSFYHSLAEGAFCCLRT